MTAADQGTAATETMHGMIQTSTGIVVGDSGGPLASAGEVIGMDAAGDSVSQQQPATGFAIPIDTVVGGRRSVIPAVNGAPLGDKPGAL